MILCGSFTQANYPLPEIERLFICRSRCQPRQASLFLDILKVLGSKVLKRELPLLRPKEGPALAVAARLACRGLLALLDPALAGTPVVEGVLEAEAVVTDDGVLGELIHVAHLRFAVLRDRGGERGAGEGRGCEELDDGGWGAGQYGCSRW